MSEFDWIRDRFDRVDADNKAIQEELECVHKQVDRHGVYWDIVKWVTLSGAGVAASIAGFFGFDHKH